MFKIEYTINGGYAMNFWRLFIMKNVLFFMLFVLFCTQQTFSRQIVKTNSNQQALIEFKKATSTGKQGIIISDLHEVVLKRLPGDLKRAQTLTGSELGRFLSGLAVFGPKYLSHKIFGYPVHPAIEEHALKHISQKSSKEHILQLISPFELDENMYTFYQNNCKNYPKFACSNIGEESYNWMNTKSTGKLDNLFIEKQISTQTNGYLQKDRTEAFEQLATKIRTKIHHPRIVALMIDDQAKNIAKCQEVLGKHGITVFGYVFKNVQELKKDFEQYDICS